MSKRKNPYAGAAPRSITRWPARRSFTRRSISSSLNTLRAGKPLAFAARVCTSAPGSWSLYAAQRVGAGGRVLAIDLSEITQIFPPNVEVVRGDALSLESEVLARHAPYDVVLSDMAPSTSGSKIRDQALSYELFMRAFEVAQAFGKPGSHFVGKIFMSGDFQAARQAVGAAYERTQVIRPDATRQQSSEVFVVGLGLSSR